MKYLVTGGAGFIGSHLVDRLINDGHEVTVVDNLSTGKQEFLNPRAVFLKQDINYSELPTGFDGCFHLAATVGVPLTEKSPALVLADTFGFPTVWNSAKRIVFISSSSVYGDSDKQSEASPVHPNSPYSAVKVLGEQYVFHAGKPATAVRIFNAYGPRQNTQFVIPRFLEAKRNGELAKVHIGFTRDFTYIDDVVEAIIRCMEKDEAIGQAINVGTGVQTSMEQLAELLDVAWEPSEVDFKRVAGREADVRKMKALLGFMARPITKELLSNV